jgi:hypothetical protein
MLEVPKIAMLPTNSITFRKYLLSKGGKPMSFPIRKIGMLKMPKIAMLSTDFACMNIHDANLLDSLYVLLRTRIDDHLSPKTKKKIRATFATTHHHLEDWPRHLIGDDFKVLQIINILYGRGTLLSIDEKAPRTEEEENTSSASEATR